MGIVWAKGSNPEGMLITTMVKIKDMGLNVCKRVWNAFADFFRALFTNPNTIVA